MNLESLVEETPNDMELGSKIEKMYWEELKTDNKTIKDLKIYESPDGGILFTKDLLVEIINKEISKMKLITKKLIKLKKKIVIPTPFNKKEVDEISVTLLQEKKRHGGIGLSANQIGINKRACVINVKEPSSIDQPKSN